MSRTNRLLRRKILRVAKDISFLVNFERYIDLIRLVDERGVVASMMFWSGTAKRSLVLAVSLAVCMGPVQLGLGSICWAESGNQEEQTGKIVNVRKVLRDPYFISRYPHIHYYILYISLRVSGQTYCSDYETPVLDEIEDLTAATSQDVAVVIKGKTITIRTPKGRKLKARLAKGNQC